jgi:hypothetical protein
VIGKNSPILLQPPRIQLFDCLSDLLVDLPAPLYEQAVVRNDLLVQGVLEDALEFREALFPVNELQAMEV